MSECRLQLTGEKRGKRFVFVCAICARQYLSNYGDADQIRGRLCVVGGPHHREPAIANSGECLHRGRLVRTEQCPTCSGTVKVKVFACAVHGECELANKIKGVKFCGTCRDFVAIES